MSEPLPLLKWFDSNRCPDFATAGNEGRCIKADSQAGVIAMFMLDDALMDTKLSRPRGLAITIQDAIIRLRICNVTSNCPDRRLREAVKWLERQGCTVIKDWVKTDTSRFMRWRVEWNAAAERALDKLTPKKA